MANGLAVLAVLIGLVIIGVLIWLYVEQVLFLFAPQNFTAAGWNNWRRIVTIVFIILALITVCLTALGMLLGGFRNGRFGARSALYVQ